MDDTREFDGALPALGDNNPPDNATLLAQRLEDVTADLRKRFDDLLSAANRAPTVCKDDDTAGKIGDFIKQITACHKSFEGMRVSEKEPYLTLERNVDGFFKKYTETLQRLKQDIVRPLEVYLKQKEAERRQAAIDEAKRQREEAERIAREAEQFEKAKLAGLAEKTMEEATRAEEQADKADKLAEAKPADFARTRGNYGSVSTLRTSWVGVILDRNDLDLEALRQHIPLDGLQKAVNAYVKAGGRELRGAKISEESVAAIK